MKEFSQLNIFNSNILRMHTNGKRKSSFCTGASSPGSRGGMVLLIFRSRRIFKNFVAAVETQKGKLLFGTRFRTISE